SESADTFGLLGVLMYAVTNRFSAEAPEQIRTTAPKHAAMPMSLAANGRTNLDLVSVTLVFIIVSFVLILLVCSSVTEVVRKSRREVTRKNQKTDEPRIRLRQRLRRDMLRGCHGLGGGH